METTNQDVRKATVADLNRIDLLARQETEALGFLPRVVIQQAIENEWMHFHEETGAFVLFRLKKNGETTLQYICVPWKHRGKGIGKLLVNSLPRPIVLKCPAFLASNEFYRGLGFIRVKFEQKTKRPVNLWRLD